jgi:lysophospholipase-1
MVEASFPNCNDKKDEGIHVAMAMHQAITTNVGIHALRPHADLHLNTWWHPLQREMNFGSIVPPKFFVGPGSLAAAGQICIARGGQPNATIVPDDIGGGLKVYLIAPLQTAHKTLSVVKKREKKRSKKNRTNGIEKTNGEMKIPESTVSTNKNIQPLSSSLLPGAVVFLHGLGDASSSWERRMSAYFRTNVFRQPKAPVQNVSAHENKPPIPSWFDIKCLPVTTKMKKNGDNDEPNGLVSSVQMVHNLLDEIQIMHEIPPSMIVLGGFSQGGALSLVAGLSYKHSLGGIVSISGWHPCYSRLKPDKVTSNSTPIFFSSGTSDPVVQYDISKESCDLLVETFGSDRVTRNIVQRGKHSPKGKELKAACTFIQECLKG